MGHLFVLIWASECCFGVMYCEWHGVCDYVVGVCAYYGVVNVFHVCRNFGVVYGVGVLSCLCCCMLLFALGLSSSQSRLPSPR